MLRPFMPVMTGSLLLAFSAAALAADESADRQAPAAGPLTLDSVNVNAEAGISGTATTEGSGSYTTGAMSTAVGLPCSTYGLSHSAGG